MEDELEDKLHRYEMEPVADDYIYNVLKDARKLGVKNISILKYNQIKKDFKDYVAINNGLSSGEIMQGINEINLGIEIYHVRHSKRSRN